MSKPSTSTYLTSAEEVRVALADGRPVVALESTVIAHGLPYPTNIEAAQAMEDAIRSEGAVPATIGLLDGRIIVGLSLAQLERLGKPGSTPIAKVSRRDLAVVLAQRRPGATTVAGTLACAELAGIRFFATGGIGGVHRGAERTMDISADLPELARTPAVTVCAGAKSILDLALTLEYLETQSVPVIGFQTDDFPAFYARSSGYPVPHRAESAREVAAIAHTQWQTRLGGGILVTCPIPEEAAIESAEIEALTNDALAQADAQHITGQAVTPFLLSHIARATGGRSVAANLALLINNATWAGRFARAYAENQV
ncbi:MAG TPA: pseudouridine-5'-phosphate glycosidase [Ktedonobacterales bacterium]|nr:pseudouridine-5'-phosphate glycosidase [Ktedonobacterales bacterium]